MDKFNEIKVKDYGTKKEYDKYVMLNFRRLIYACIFIQETRNNKDTTSEDIYKFLLKYDYPENYITKHLQSCANSISGQGYIVVVSKKVYCLSTNINILRKAIYDLKKVKNDFLKDSYDKDMDKISKEYMKEQANNITNIIKKYQDKIDNKH